MVPSRSSIRESPRSDTEYSSPLTRSPNPGRLRRNGTWKGPQTSGNDSNVRYCPPMKQASPDTIRSSSNGWLGNPRFSVPYTKISRRLSPPVASATAAAAASDVLRIASTSPDLAFLDWL
ncbi:hypothetical protein Dimus_000320 [Dionaea muscipula]